MEGESLLKRTLVYVGAMLGGGVLFIGILSLTAVFVTHRIVTPAAEKADEKALTAPAKPSSETSRPNTESANHHGPEQI